MRKSIESDEVPWRHRSIVPEPYDGEIHYVEEYLRYSVLKPGPDHIVKKTRTMLLQPAEKYDLLISSQASLYVLGFIYYRDDFGQHHKMAF